MRPALVAVLLATACAPVPDLSQVPAGRVECSTACGLRTLGTAEDCADVQRFEVEALASYAPVFPDGCGALVGVTLLVRRDTAQGWWVEPDGRQVRGSFDWDTRTIEVADVALARGGAFHEVGHALDYTVNDAWKRDPGVCTARTPGCGDLHWDWAASGIKATVDAWEQAHP